MPCTRLPFVAFEEKGLDVPAELAIHEVEFCDTNEPQDLIPEQPSWGELPAPSLAKFMLLGLIAMGLVFFLVGMFA